MVVSAFPAIGFVLNSSRILNLPIIMKEIFHNIN